MVTDAGRSFLEASRGALSHWIDIANITTNR
jgi:Ni,Fe-hydrogenase I large subunit